MKSHARRLNGSACSGAGASAMALGGSVATGVGVGVAPGASEGCAAGTQAARARATSRSRSSAGPQAARAGWEASRGGSSLSGQGRSRPDCQGGSSRSGERPSSCPEGGRSVRSPARCTASRWARSGTRTAATRTGIGTGGSTRSRSASHRCSFQNAAASQLPAERLDQCPVVGGDERRPGDEQDVPARLNVRRHRPEHPADAVAGPDFGRPPSRGPDWSPCRTASSRGRSAGSWPRGAGGIASSPAPGAPRSPAGGRASRGATGSGRARPSGRQALPTASPACGQDAASAGGLHPGAEAVFLGAMSLLGLVGLLHRGCAGSSPSGLGVWSIS